MRPLSRTIRPELVAVAALLAAATAVFWTTRLDLVAGDLFREPCCAWPLAERQPWSFIYRYGVLAGVLLAAGALVTLTLSYWYPARLHAWRRPALFLVLAAALGPGLVVNVALKDHWGRPRPREVVELGGQERYLPVWVKGSEPQAKSFPCGHCSMGFYLSVPWLVLKRRRRRTALAFLVAGIAWGGLLGAARMMAGGHFLSDVVWAGGIVWLVALGLYHLMDLDREPAPAPAVDRRRARLATALGGGALALLTVAVLLATPYVSRKTTGLTAAQLAASPAAALAVRLDDATVTVEAGPELQASYEVQAFGFPTSKLNFAWRETADAAVLTIEPLGWFTERRTAVRLRLPAGGEKPLRLELARGKVGLDLRGFSPATRFDVAVGEGELRVTGGEALEAAGRVHLSVGRGAVVRAP
ncbi:MAG TPA: phosphatase PAP2 family protein [Anaeromyxobacteraceae bacterium]|nr:phosphatase PAP2 family protein [Anaeromyxobacteraceae bacterium]